MTATCNTTATDTAAATLRAAEPALWAWLATLLIVFFLAHLGVSLLLLLGRSASGAGPGERLSGPSIMGRQGEGAVAGCMKGGSPQPSRT